MEKINFKDGELVKKGYVTIDGIEHEVTEAEYEGETPLSAYILNKLQDNVEEAIKEVEESGKIIDNFDTTEDKTINAPSIQAVESFIEDKISNVNENLKKIKLFKKLLTIDITDDGNDWRFCSEEKTYVNSIDLSKYDWFPDNVVSILSSQGFKTDFGLWRCQVVPEFNKETSSVMIYAPSAGNYTIDITILYEE